MKPRLARCIFICTVVLALNTCFAHALEVPPLRARVNDLAGMMGEHAAAQLEHRLSQFETQTKHQVAVLIIPSLNGDSLEDFSIRLAEAWKIGNKAADDGVILIIARDDRKIRIEVGYGLEGVLPDAMANRIIQEVIVPQFRNQDFTGGIELGVSAIIQAVEGEQSFTKPSILDSAPKSSLSAILTLLVATILFSSVVGFAQPSLGRAAFIGAAVTGVIGLRALSAVGFGIWLLAILTGAVAGMLPIHFARRAWGRSWSVRSSKHDDYSPRDMLSRGYGGGGTSGSGGSGFGGSSSGSGRGGGGFGGGGASGGW